MATAGEVQVSRVRYYAEQELAVDGAQKLVDEYGCDLAQGVGEYGCDLAGCDLR